MFQRFLFFGWQANEKIRPLCDGIFRWVRILRTCGNEEVKVYDWKEWID